MSFSYQALIFFHVAVGFASLVLFWLPIFAKKGSARHARTGHWYVKAMYAVGVSALILALMLMIDPLAFKFAGNEFSVEEAISVASQQRDIGLFLLAISLLVMVGVRHGLQSIRAKGNHALMRRFDSLAINVILLAAGLVLAYTASGNSPLSVLFYIFAALCTFTSIGNLRYCLKAKVNRNEQIIAHLGAIIGAGIGSHTAFFVFGASKVLSEMMSGYYLLIPWVLPGVVGGLLILVQARRYKPRKSKGNKSVIAATS